MNMPIYKLKKVIFQYSLDIIRIKDMKEELKIISKVINYDQ